MPWTSLQLLYQTHFRTIISYLRREVAVREILSRHCKADDECEKLSEKETLLIDSLKVPSRWIYEAKVISTRITHFN